MHLDWGIDNDWTLFLDRDGVINHRIIDGYVTKKEDFKLLDGVRLSMEMFRDLFKYIFVVTNQQGIAKGLMSERNLEEIHRYMIDSLGGENLIDQIYFAPELKSDSMNTRKPKPDMALKAQFQYKDVDFSKSIMIGDTDSDIDFGKNLGMKTVRIKTDEKIGVEADLTCNDLFEVAKLFYNN